MLGYDIQRLINSIFFFFNDTATTEIYTLSLHDALPILFFICFIVKHGTVKTIKFCSYWIFLLFYSCIDRKSTRLNSSHLVISYAVFCLKKKNTKFLECSTIHSRMIFALHAILNSIR